MGRKGDRKRIKSVSAQKLEKARQGQPITSPAPWANNVDLDPNPTCSDPPAPPNSPLIAETFYFIFSFLSPWQNADAALSAWMHIKENMMENF